MVILVDSSSYQLDTASAAPFNITYQLTIRNKNNEYIVDPLDEVTLTRGIDCTPAKLQFKVMKDDILDFTEGNHCTFSVNGTPVFAGYVFTKARDKDEKISVTAYDQLRYFKNKDCYVYYDKTATEVLKMIVDDFKLTVGELADTQYKITKRIEKDKSLTDIMNVALYLTTNGTPKHTIYQLYDDGGKLTLKSEEDMKLDLLIDADVMENFTCNSSIDKDTFDYIKVVRNVPDGKTKKLMRTGVIVDEDHVKEWGRLQQLYMPDDKVTNAMDLAINMIKLKNRKTRELRLKSVLGDIRVRGGSVVYVKYNFGDLALDGYVFVESVTHNFLNGLHLMDLDLHYEEPTGKYTIKYNTDAEAVAKIQQANKQRTYTTMGGSVMNGSTYSPTEQGAYSKMKSLGATDAQAAGIMGNIRHEDNSYSPTDSNGDHYGLFQLSDDRWGKYQDWCTANGNDPWNNDNQIQYVLTVENGNILTGESSLGQVPDDPAASAKWFNDNIEVSETSAAMGGDSSERIASANDVFSNIQSGSIGVEQLNTMDAITGNGGIASQVDTGIYYMTGYQSVYGSNGCADVALKTLAYANPDCAQLANEGVASVPTARARLESMGYSCEPFNGYANKGDILIYGDDYHMTVSNGVGGCFGNSSSRGEAMNYGDANYAWHDGESPTKIIRMEIQ
ncbi:phage tail tip lysozyme [Megasphaera vaginalis (ex Srinivasan et al. 2021)]|uniref:Uncharacterized protein n=1 Tax=Megasphaera vaginalis (ex Srinivasan et al. 2021) TaxID=1111454 RepID=U7UPQ1_9FIRM|nr:phage tail tip lysozyme [Megasphaera vaginalis (ex Srinivasan et al. 2021)]ERT61251.1 hypothetical protein HMPREF1250_0162 [Megasphaera vaginalis (ex Srinivasan et al. 2021)]